MSDHRDGADYGYGYGHGPGGPYGDHRDGAAQGRGHDEQGHGGAPYAPDGTYVPEPLPTALPPNADQGLTFGAPPPGDGWSAHAAGQDGPAYGAPAPGDGWGATPAAAHPWTAPQDPWPPYADPSAPAGAPHYGTHAPDHGTSVPGAPGYASSAGASGYGSRPPGAPDHGTAPGAPAGYGSPAAAPGAAGYGSSAGVPGAAGGPFGEAAFDGGAPWQGQPHAYAYAEPQAHGTEHTAVLPLVPDGDDVPGAGGGRRAARRGGAAVRTDGRTGSPIVPPGIQPAALTAALGLLLAGGAAAGRPALAVVLVLLQAVTAAGWFRLNGMWPARQGIVLAFLAGVTADAAMLASEGRHAPVAMAGTLGIWLLLVLVLQLRHHGSADERLSSLTATSASTLLTVLAGCYLAALVSHAGHGPVVTGAVAVAAATLVRALPLPGEPLSLTAALLAAAAAGVLTGHTGGLGGGDGVLLAVACGACALVGLRVASYDWPSRFVHFTAGVALPLTAAAPVVYALGRALT